MATQITVLGSDNVAPQYDPGARWCIWNLNEIFDGGPGANKYVPKVGDYVVDTTNNKTYIVLSLTPLLIPTYKEIDNDSSTGESLLHGNRGTFLLYFDNSVTPHILAVDSRHRVFGSENTYVKLYKGSNTSSTGTVIAQLFDSSGNYLTDKIPLAIAHTDSHDTSYGKAATVAHTKYELTDGEKVTLVAYNADGHATHTETLTVVCSSFIRDVSASTRYISHISLRSPFLSSTDEHLLQFPINISVNALNLQGVLHYSGPDAVGEIESVMPVDGIKFSINGLERFVGTKVGQRVPLVLSYKLDNDEITYAAVSANGKYITEAYWLESTNQDGAYTVKLYTYPVWDQGTNTYYLKWFLMDLNRDILFDVTSAVRYSDTGDTFDGDVYNLVQNLDVKCNLRDVSESFKDYIFVQTVSVKLNVDGNSSDRNRWLVGYVPSTPPDYGTNTYVTVKAVNANLSRINVSGGNNNIGDWLSNIYKKTYPLYDSKTELEAPSPTHFRVRTSLTGQGVEFPVESWNQTLQINTMLPTSGTLFIEFVKRTDTGDLRLSIAGMSIVEST